MDGILCIKMWPRHTGEERTRGKADRHTHTHTHRHARERNELKYTHRSHNKTAVKKGQKKKEQKETL